MDLEERQHKVKSWADRLLGEGQAMDYFTAMEIAESTMIKEEAKEEADADHA